MALDSTEVRVAVTGALYSAPLGTAKPTSAVSVLDPDFEHLGYFSDDGVTESHSDSVSTIVAWQNAQVVRSTRTESLTTLAFKPIQSRGSVLELFHPGSVMTEPSPGLYEIDIVPPISDPRTFLFDAIDGTTRYRLWIPRGEVTERGEIMYANGEPVGYPMTVTFYPNSANVLETKMSNDPSWGEGLLAS